MKIVILIFIISFVAIGEVIESEEKKRKGSIRIGVGSNFKSEYYEYQGESREIGRGFGLILEGGYSLNEKTELISGINYQKIDELEFIPLYVALNYKPFNRFFYIKPLVGISYNLNIDRLQFSFIDGETNLKYNHGYYYGIAMGVELSKVEVELFYNTNTIILDYKEDELNVLGDIFYRRFGINIIFKIDKK